MMQNSVMVWCSPSLATKQELVEALGVGFENFEERWWNESLLTVFDSFKACAPPLEEVTFSFELELPRLMYLKLRFLAEEIQEDVEVSMSDLATWCIMVGLNLLKAK